MRQFSEKNQDTVDVEVYEARRKNMKPTNSPDEIPKSEQLVGLGRCWAEAFNSRMCSWAWNKKTT